MGAPKHARDTDNGRYYQVPGTDQRYISVTNALGHKSIPALAPAAAKLTAEYIIENLPRAVRACLRESTREQFLKEAKAEHHNVWEHRRGLGTRVHDLAEAHVLGKPTPADEDAEPFLDQYLAFLADFGIDIQTDIESAEITVLHHEYRYGGTADLWVNLRSLPREQPRGRWLIDIKTSETKPPSTIYDNYVLQLAALRYAQVALLPDDSEVVVPEFAGAAILNLRAKAYGFVPLTDLVDESAFRAFTGLLATAYWVHELDLKPHKPLKAPVVRPVGKKGAA